MPNGRSAPNVRDFPTLIRWLANKHHEGAIYPMADDTGLSQALLDKWVKGMVANPRIGSIIQLAQAYDLDHMWVISLVARPFLRRAKRALACLVGGIGLAIVGGLGLAHADSPTPSATPTAMRDYVSFRRRKRLRVVGLRGTSYKHPGGVLRGFPLTSAAPC